MSSALTSFVHAELAQAVQCEKSGDMDAAFSYLERAHILSQYSTRQHVAVHGAMFEWAWKRRDYREMFGQVIRLAGAATKTALGFIPTGNTGGTNVSPIKPMPVPDDLAKIIAENR